MNNIKLRCWDTELKEWNTSYVIQPDAVYRNYKDLLDGKHTLALEFQRYTGLKDKNGVEIAEGDIVEYQYLNTLDQEMRISEVKLMSIGDVNRNITAYYPFCCSISGSYKERDREITDCYLTPANDSVILGNVKDNPELLEVK